MINILCSATVVRHDRAACIEILMPSAATVFPNYAQLQRQRLCAWYQFNQR